MVLDPNRIEELRARFSTNERLVDRALRHSVFLERYKAGEIRRIVRFIEQETMPAMRRKLFQRLDRISGRGFDPGPRTTEAVRKMLDELDAIVHAGYVELAARSKSGLFELAKSERDFQVGALSQEVPFTFAFSAPDVGLIRSAVVSRPFQGRLLRDWYRTLDVSARADMRRRIQTGITAGESTADIVRRVSPSSVFAGTRRNQIEAVARTAVNHTSTHAREEVYRANSDVISGVLWVSTLDDRITYQCLELDGERFAIGYGYRPPIHMGCRSTTVPILAPFEAFGLSAEDLSPRQRASMNGAVPAKITAEEWLRTQSEATQNKVLGRGVADHWRRGEIKTADLTNRNLEPLSLAQIRKREGLAA